jgi:hypothetical protein
MATFGAAPGQNFTAVGGGHACAEAVSAWRRLLGWNVLFMALIPLVNLEVN